MCWYDIFKSHIVGSASLFKATFFWLNCSRPLNIIEFLIDVGLSFCFGRLLIHKHIMYMIFCSMAYIFCYCWIFFFFLLHSCTRIQLSLSLPLVYKDWIMYILLIKYISYKKIKSELLIIKWPKCKLLRMLRKGTFSLYNRQSA